MTEQIDTCGVMQKEPKVEERNVGGAHVQGDPLKRRSIEEATSQEK